MRKNFLLLISFLGLVGCATTPRGEPPIAPASHGITLEEEAAVLRLEDRREFDAGMATKWAGHPNSLHRARIAVALGRIGPATFTDSNGNGEKDTDEKMAGVELLDALTTDSDISVRRAAAFALGEIGDPAGVQSLLTLAANRDYPDVAAEAIEALSKYGASAPRELYLPFTTATHVEGVRARAIRYLFRLNHDEASAAALPALADSNVDIRREAAYAFSRRAHAPARPQLEALFGDRDTLIRAYAARALGIIGDSASLTTLIEALGDPHPWVRANAARAVAQIAQKDVKAIDRPQIGEDAVRVITLTQDPDPGTRVTAIEPLGFYALRNEAAKKRLFELAVQGNSWQREVATGAFARHFGDFDPSSLGSLLQTDATWVKVRVLEASGQLSKNGATFRSRLAVDSDIIVRGAAIGAIPDDQVDKEIELIRTALEDDDIVVRTNAIDRYALSKVDPVETRLETLLHAENRARSEPMSDARLAAVRAIGDLDLPRRESFLRGLMGDADPMVRRVSAELIAEKLKAKKPQYTPLAVDRPLSDYVEIAQWASQKHTATIHMGRGRIELVLLPQDAPMTAKNFADLAQRGFFNNTSFMRVVPNFVIQGGDPRNDQNGGPGYAIRDEINQQRYTRGAVGMALSGLDTGGSQFFITHSPQPHLDGGYTIFARVVGGMSGVADQTERGDRVERITIDENKRDAEADFAAVQKTPLPTETGPTNAARLLAVVPEYQENKNGYQPDRDVLEMMAASVQLGDRVEVYLGTWCSDSQREVPKYFKIVDTLQNDYGVALPTTYFGLDRSKKGPAHLIEGKAIEKVATFIYYRNDQELGRIIEKPNGLIEDDLLQIVAGKP